MNAAKDLKYAGLFFLEVRTVGVGFGLRTVVKREDYSPGYVSKSTASMRTSGFLSMHSKPYRPKLLFILQATTGTCAGYPSAWRCDKNWTQVAVSPSHLSNRADFVPSDHNVTDHGFRCR